MGRFSGAWERILSQHIPDADSNLTIPHEELSSRLRRISEVHPYQVSHGDIRRVERWRNGLEDALAEISPPRITSLYGGTRNVPHPSIVPYTAARRLVEEYINPYPILEKEMNGQLFYGLNSYLRYLLDLRHQLSDLERLDNYPELADPGPIIDSIILDRANPGELVRRIRIADGLEPSGDSFSHDFERVKEYWDKIASYPTPPATPASATKRRMQRNINRAIRDNTVMIDDASNYPYLGTEIEL